MICGVLKGLIRPHEMLLRLPQKSHPNAQADYKNTKYPDHI